jgi:hypothetical protein
MDEMESARDMEAMLELDLKLLVSSERCRRTPLWLLPEGDFACSSPLKPTTLTNMLDEDTTGDNWMRWKKLSGNLGWSLVVCRGRQSSCKTVGCGQARKRELQIECQTLI